MRRVVLSALAVFSILMLVSCGGEARKVKNVVTFYNKVLIDAYQRPNSSLMENFTSIPERVRIDNYISYLLKDNKLLKGEIREFTFENVSIKGDEAEVITKERWVYSYMDSRTRKPLSKEYDATFANTYYLRKLKGRWVVNNLDSKLIAGEKEEQESDEMEKLHQKMYKELEERRKNK